MNPQSFTLLLVTLVLPADARGQASATAISDDIAKEAASLFALEFKSTDEKIRLAAVDRLSKLRHEAIVKCLSRAIDDPRPVVRAEAAVRLSEQDPKLAVAVLRRALLDRERNDKVPAVLVAVLQSYRALALSPELGDLKRFDNWTKEVQKEAILTLRHLRKMEVLDFLAPLLDDPIPENVDSPTNPPGSYWKDRLERWRHWIGAVQETMDVLTGCTFEDQKAFKEWKRKGGKVLPLKPPPEPKKG